MHEMKNELESIENRAHQREERISSLKDKNLEMTVGRRELKFWKSEKLYESYNILSDKQMEE